MLCLWRSTIVCALARARRHSVRHSLGAVARNKRRPTVLIRSRAIAGSRSADRVAALRQSMHRKHAAAAARDMCLGCLNLVDATHFAGSVGAVHMLVVHAPVDQWGIPLLAIEAAVLGGARQARMADKADHHLWVALVGAAALAGQMRRRVQRQVDRKIGPDLSVRLARDIGRAHGSTFLARRLDMPALRWAAVVRAAAVMAAVAE